MLPNNQVRTTTERVVAQSTVSSDITDKFTKAASSKKNLSHFPHLDNWNAVAVK